MTDTPIVSEDLKIAANHMFNLAEMLKIPMDDIFHSHLEQTYDGTKSVPGSIVNLANEVKEVVEQLQTFAHFTHMAEAPRRRIDHINYHASRLRNSNTGEPINISETLQKAKELVGTVEGLTGGSLTYLTYPDPNNGLDAIEHRASETIDSIMLPAVGDGKTIVGTLLDEARRRATPQISNFIPNHQSGGRSQ